MYDKNNLIYGEKFDLIIIFQISNDYFQLLALNVTNSQKIELIQRNYKFSATRNFVLNMVTANIKSKQCVEQVRFVWQ